MKYKYNENAQTTITSFDEAQGDGLKKKGNNFIGNGEKFPIIKSNVEVYATGEWTDGKKASFRITIPLEYVAGYESGALDKISNQIESLIKAGKDGRERISTVEINKIEGIKKGFVAVKNYFKGGKEVQSYWKKKPNRYTPAQINWLHKQKVINAKTTAQFNKQFGTEISHNALASKRSRL